MNILFLCKGNVGRSQIAEVLFRKKFGDEHIVVSAGTKLSGPEQPIGELLPNIQEVLDVMREEGLDVAPAIRKQMTEEMVNTADKVIVIMEDTEELPEYLVNSPKLIRWCIPDPKGKDLVFTRNVRDQIKNQIKKLTF
jgi:arsenate reductase